MRALPQLLRRPSFLFFFLIVGVAIAFVATQILATPGDTIADRELGQGDFVHNVTPSFVRAKSLDLQGNPRGQGVAIDTKANPNHLFVSDENSNRVLGWMNAGTITNGQNADIVIGAPDFFTHQGGCIRNDTGFCSPFTVGVDTAHNLFVGGDHVEEFADPFSQTPPFTGSTFIAAGGIVDPWGVASDSNGNIYVANRTGTRCTNMTLGPRP